MENLSLSYSNEQNILYLQNQFLINGFHYFKVKNILDGRKIILTMLNSLNYYNNIACLTSNNNEFRENVFDIYYTLTKENSTENIDNLVNFFLETFDFDFMWIEESKDFIETSWYKIFKQHLIDFNFYKVIPIMIIS